MFFVKTSSGEVGSLGLHSMSSLCSFDAETTTVASLVYRIHVSAPLAASPTELQGNPRLPPDAELQNYGRNIPGILRLVTSF